jgi:ribosomal protein S18 acetylase RimI-like enzyme
MWNTCICLMDTKEAHMGLEGAHRNNGYIISTDKLKLDVGVIHDFLSNKSYWGKGRTVAAVRKTIDNSLCFGVYDKKDRLVGFARVVTDLTIFAYLMDVFIVEEHRGRGLGKQLIDHIINASLLQDIRFWRLDTDDAHGLYRKYGFQEPAFPGKIMEKRNVANTVQQFPTEPRR